MISHSQNSAAAQSIATAAKKRRKRSKKKKSKNVSETASDSDSSDDDNFINTFSHAPEVGKQDVSRMMVEDFRSNLISDPTAELMQQVVAASGRSTEEVAEVLNEMWELDLPVSSAENVLTFLKKKAMRIETAPALVPSPASITSNVSNIPSVPSPRLSSRAPPSPLASPLTPTRQFKSEGSRKSAPSVEAEGVSDYPSLLAKLEAAASHPDIFEGLVALCSWLGLSGSAIPLLALTKKSPLEAFFESRSLELLLQSLFTESSQVQRQEVRAALLTFFAAILQTSDDSAAAVHKIVNDLEKVARQLELIRGRGDGSGAGRSFSVLSPVALSRRIGLSIRKLHDASLELPVDSTEVASQPSGGAALLLQLEGSRQHVQLIDGAISALKNNKNIPATSLQHFLQLRDMEYDKFLVELKDVEDLRSFVVSRGRTAPIPAASNSRHRPGLDKITGSADDDYVLEQGLLSDCGESKYSIDKKCSRGEIVATYLKVLTEERSQKESPINDKLDECQLKLSRVSKRKEELLTELQSLSSEEDTLNSQIAALKSSLQECEKSFSMQLSVVQSSNKEVVETIQLRDNLAAIVEQVRHLDRMLADSIGLLPSGENSERIESKRALTRAHESSNQQKEAAVCELLPSKMAAASTALDGFARAAAGCICSLASRIELSRTKLGHLEEEVLVYRNLSMASMTAELTNSITSLRSNIEEDVTSVNFLQKELATALVRFAGNLSLGTPGASTVQLPLESLAEIVGALSDASVVVLPELLTFAANVSPRKQKKTSNSGSQVNHSGSTANGGSASGKQQVVVSTAKPAEPKKPQNQKPPIGKVEPKEPKAARVADAKAPILIPTNVPRQKQQAVPRQQLKLTPEYISSIGVKSAKAVSIKSEDSVAAKEKPERVAVIPVDSHWNNNNNGNSNHKGSPTSRKAPKKTLLEIQLEQAQQQVSEPVVAKSGEANSSTTANLPTAEKAAGKEKEDRTRKAAVKEDRSRNVGKTAVKEKEDRARNDGKAAVKEDMARNDGKAAVKEDRARNVGKTAVKEKEDMARNDGIAAVKEGVARNDGKAAVKEDRESNDGKVATVNEAAGDNAALPKRERKKRT